MSGSLCPRKSDGQEGEEESADQVGSLGSGRGADGRL